MSIHDLIGSDDLSKLIINGKCSLNGEVRISGAKNSALALLAASVLTDEAVVLHNIPDISDVRDMLMILRMLGCYTKAENNTVTICAKGLVSHTLPCCYSKKIRSSVFLMGPLVAKTGRADVCFPGGCNIGKRPIDMHISGLKSIGIDIDDSGSDIICRKISSFGGRVVFPYPSVGATENVMMAAALSEKDTVIHNAAMEPEIVDLAGLLSLMGAEIRGAGSSDIYIKGKRRLNGAEFTCMPDRIEAGTFIISAAAAKGCIGVKNMIPDHILGLIDLLKAGGAGIKTYDNVVEIICRKPLCFDMMHVVTMPYPGFPTDLQPQTGALFAVSDGTASINETVFESRYGYTEQLKKMGARINNKNGVIYFCPSVLKGTEMTAPDLRAGAALVIAAMAAEGQSIIENSEVIFRGYESFIEKFSAIGADIKGIQ